MSPPPGLAVLLVADRLDPKTIAVASCVCKSWNKIMSSDNVWEPICLSHYPSLSSLLSRTIPHHNLFSLLRNSTLRRSPNPPRISVQHLTFAVDVFSRDRPILSISIPGRDLARDESDVFRFHVSVEDQRDRVLTKASTVIEETRVVWTVVMEGTKGVFLMMECGGGMKGKVVVMGNEVWFSEVMKRSGCSCVESNCNLGKNSGIVAEMGLVLVEGMRVGCLRLGLISSVSWRYLSMGDGLRYLENFVLLKMNSLRIILWCSSLVKTCFDMTV